MTEELSSSLSYVKGEFEGEDRYPLTTNFGYVDKWAELRPEKEAFVFRPSETEREVITYGQLKTATENIAVWLRREFTVSKGDRVGILSLNRLSYVLCDLALCRLGAVSVRIYVTMDTKSELTRNLGDTDCRLFLCQYASLPSVGTILPLASHDPRQRLVSPELPKLEHVICMTGETSPGTISLPEWNSITVTDNEKRELYDIQSTIKLTDDCSVYSTSGSTGVPKFVVHSYAGVLTFAPTIIRRCKMTSDDKYFADRPLAHLGGNAMSVITLGATMVVANPWKTLAGNQAAYLLTIMKEENVNCGLSFPYLLYDIVKSGDASAEFQKINAKFFIFAGQLVNIEIMKVVKDKLESPIVNGYGCTEMGGICSTMTTDTVDVLSKFSGYIVPGLEVKVVDPETRQILPRGQIGRIGLRCSHKWYYLNNEKKMKESHDEDGYFYPGDLVRMAENGYIEVLGREDDQMSVGTIKVYPAPIEMMICKHPAVDKAIVFGVPDERLHEVIGAVVQPKPGANLAGDDIIQFFTDSTDKANLMTGSATAPKFVWVEESFPLTSSGKVDKKRLREQCLKSLGIDVRK